MNNYKKKIINCRDEMRCYRVEIVKAVATHQNVEKSLKPPLECWGLHRISPVVFFTVYLKIYIKVQIH